MAFANCWYVMFWYPASIPVGDIYIAANVASGSVAAIWSTAVGIHWLYKVEVLLTWLTWLTWLTLMMSIMARIMKSGTGMFELSLSLDCLDNEVYEKFTNLT